MATTDKSVKVIQLASQSYIIGKTLHLILLSLLEF